MKFLFSFIVFLAGFVQLSGSSYLPADSAMQSNAFEETFINDLNQPHFDVVHSQNLELRIAEFEIEESDRSISKASQSLATATLATRAIGRMSPISSRRRSSQWS